MKVAVCQTSPVLFDVQANLEEVIQKIQEARGKGADLIVFPELALTGYFLGQKYHEVALRLDSKEIERLAAATRGTAAVVGFVEESPSMNFYNSALVAVDGEILYAYRKLNLPNYGVFEERKYFSSGKQVPVFKYHDMTIAVFICNDLWHPSLPYLGISQKAEVLVSIFNSSQGSMGSEFSNIESWGIINTFYARIFGVYNVCANRVGKETLELKESVPEGLLTGAEAAVEKANPAPVRTTYNFWGGSEIVNPFGKQIARAAQHEKDEIWGDISRDLLRQKRILLPYLRNDDPYFTHRQLERILYDIDDRRLS